MDAPLPLPPGFGQGLPEMRSPLPGPRTRELALRLARVESRNVTYLESPPIFWTEARGANVRDADGNVFLDLTGAFGVAVAGHANPVIGAALADQASRLVHGMGDVHPPEIKVRLLERLARLSPWEACRGFLANSGSEAVEAALKTALLATGRPGILAFEGGYHGLTLGSLAATHRADFRAPFAPHLHGGVKFAPFPDVLGAQSPAGAAAGAGASSEAGSGPRAQAAAGAAALARVDELLAEAEAEGMPVGAVIVEPIQGRAGVRVPVPGFLAGVAERARAAGALVIHDEIFSGLGRTGRDFAAAWEGPEATPDLVCVGKSLGGGLPLSACLGEASVMDAWPRSEGEALHTSTFLGHPLACATSLAFLDLMETGGLMSRALELGDRLRQDLSAALQDVTALRGLRGRGLFLGLVLDGDGAPPLAGVRVAEEALRRGVIVLPAGPCGEVVELSPPLVLTDAQAAAAVEIVAASVRSVVAGR